MYSVEKPKQDGPPESPTTARELDFDDDPQEAPASDVKLASISRRQQQVSDEDVPPPKPPRPLNPNQIAENNLREAFPTIDTAVIKAVLQASGGRVEPAFDALLGMSDPDARIQPIQPPRQIQADAQYAQQLQEYYSNTTANSEAPRIPPRRRPSPDDSLQVIGEKIKKSFLETQSVVSSWIKKKIEGDEDDDDYQDRPARPASNYNTRPSQQQFVGRRSRDFERRSVDRNRYDADPHVLGDDFANLQLRDHDDPPRRPLANPDLFKPTPQRPQSGNGRQVSFREGPPEEIGTPYRKSPDSANRIPSAGSKASKWQPLSAVEPSPVTDHDPFSLGDSDDEESKKKDGRLLDITRSKQPTVEAVSDDIGTAGRRHVDHAGNLDATHKEAEKLT